MRKTHCYTKFGGVPTSGRTGSGLKRCDGQKELWRARQAPYLKLWLGLLADLHFNSVDRVEKAKMMAPNMYVSFNARSALKRISRT